MESHPKIWSMTVLGLSMLLVSVAALGIAACDGGATNPDATSAAGAAAGGSGQAQPTRREGDLGDAIVLSDGGDGRLEVTALRLKIFRKIAFTRGTAWNVFGVKLTLRNVGTSPIHLAAVGENCVLFDAGGWGYDYPGDSPKSALHDVDLGYPGDSRVGWVCFAPTTGAAPVATTCAALSGFQYTVHSSDSTAAGDIGYWGWTPGTAATALPTTPRLPAPTVAGTLVFAKVVDADIPNYDIYRVNSDGTGLRRLTDGPGVEEHPSWSPDGKRIVYSDYEKGTLWIMNADGSGKVKLGDGSAPHWSPDGKQIVYSAGGIWDGSGVYVMNADGSDQRCVVFHGPAFTPSWGPNGAIVFVRDDDLCAVNVDGSGLAQLTTNAGMRQYLVSPDGRTVAAYDGPGDRLVAMPLQGDGPAATLLHPALQYIPDGGEPTAAWTADGRALVLGSSTWGETLGSSLYVVNADGSGLSQVPGVENALSAAWRPGQGVRP